MGHGKIAEDKREQVIRMVEVSRAVMKWIVKKIEKTLHKLCTCWVTHEKVSFP
jgi:hypothetical protein